MTEEEILAPPQSSDDEIELDNRETQAAKRGKTGNDAVPTTLPRKAMGSNGRTTVADPIEDNESEDDVGSRADIQVTKFERRNPAASGQEELPFGVKKAKTTYPKPKRKNDATRITVGKVEPLQGSKRVNEGSPKRVSKKVKKGISEGM
jgi:hypothetical protein